MIPVRYVGNENRIDRGEGREKRRGWLAGRKRERINQPSLLLSTHELPPAVRITVTTRKGTRGLQTTDSMGREMCPVQINRRMEI